MNTAPKSQKKTIMKIAVKTSVNETITKNTYENRIILWI